MPFESSLKKTYNLFKKNVEIPWVKDNIQKIIEEKDFPILLSDLNNTIFTPTIELDDSISFGKAIEEFLRNPNKAKEMGGNGFQKVKDLFMIDKMLNDHNEYFLRFK